MFYQATLSELFWMHAIVLAFAAKQNCKCFYFHCRVSLVNTKLKLMHSFMLLLLWVRSVIQRSVRTQ